MWVCTITGCRNFEDFRTPCKAFVTIAFQPSKKDSKLPDITIVKKAANNIEDEERLEKVLRNNVAYVIAPLNPQIGFITLEIHDPSISAARTILTMHYQKEAVLISHQCGCAYKYKLNKVEITGHMKCKIISKELSTVNDSPVDIQIYL